MAAARARRRRFPGPSGSCSFDSIVTGGAGFRRRVGIEGSFRSARSLSHGEQAEVGHERVVVVKPGVWWNTTTGPSLPSTVVKRRFTPGESVQAKSNSCSFVKSTGFTKCASHNLIFEHLLAVSSGVVSDGRLVNCSCRPSRGVMDDFDLALRRARPGPNCLDLRHAEADVLGLDEQFGVVCLHLVFALIVVVHDDSTLVALFHGELRFRRLRCLTSRRTTSCSVRKSTCLRMGACHFLSGKAMGQLLVAGKDGMVAERSSATCSPCSGGRSSARAG